MTDTASCLTPSARRSSGAPRTRDFRARGYAHVIGSAGSSVTVFRAPEPAHYAAANLEWLISAGARAILFLNGAGVGLAAGMHWTTVGTYRERFAKVVRTRERGVVSVDMELSALAGVAHFRGCERSALLVIADVLKTRHTRDETNSARFHDGVARAAEIATLAAVACDDS